METRTLHFEAHGPLWQPGFSAFVEGDIPADVLDPDRWTDVSSHELGAIVSRLTGDLSRVDDYRVTLVRRSDERFVSDGDDATRLTTYVTELYGWDDAQAAELAQYGGA